MKESFRDKRFTETSLARIDLCNEIIDDYLSQGLRLTLRQLYYQLVTRNAIVNREQDYKNLGTLVSDARLAGLMDWEAIEDRVRQPRRASEFANLDELVQAALDSYRLPRWATQKRYAELWVEKDALAGVLEPLSREYHVTLMVNRGYSSQSAMYESAQRFMATDKPGVLFYLGDHDPSGEDMVRDIQARLDLFGADVTVIKIALTRAQVDQYQPPPNPAKITDSRAAAYIALHGPSSWEVDALPPNVLADIVRAAFRAVVDVRAMNVIKRQETADKARLREALASLNGA